MDDKDLFSQLFRGFKPLETKDEITKKYVQGTISKDEFLKRMKEIDENK